MKRFGALCVLMLAACGDCGTSSNGDPNGNPNAEPNNTVDMAVDAADDDTGAPGGPGLPGAPGDNALDAIEDVDLRPHPEDAWFVDGTVRDSLTRLVFMPSDAATVGEVNELIAAHGGEIAGAASIAGWVAIDIPPDETGEAIVAAENAFIDSAAIDVAVTEIYTEPLRLSGARATDAHLDRTDACPDALSTWEWTTETAGSNWGLKFARVPFAWNYRELAMELDDVPQIGIVERAYNPGHGDVSALATTTPTGPEGSDGNHGLEVASVMAADFDDIGVDGILPLDVSLTGVLTTGGDAADLDAAWRLIRGTPVRLVNNSNGVIWSGVDPTARKYSGLSRRTREDDMDERGTLWSNTFARGASVLEREFLVVCAAGNEGLSNDLTYLARHTGGCANAAVIAEDPRFFAAENLRTSGPSAFGDDLYVGSNRNGNIAAPGTCVGVATNDDEYATVFGTSFAAPFVAASAAYLWSLAPDATGAQIRQALLDGAKDESNASSRRVDLWASARQLDTTLNQNVRAVALRDVDDGTVDGNLRQHPGGAATTPGDRGDGCVDMRDFRAMRDALLVATNPATTALDGPVDHVSRDLNGDGVVGAPDASQTGAAPVHTMWARYDLNADNDVDIDDLQQLLFDFGECRDETRTARTEGYEPTDLEVLDISAGMAVFPMADSWDAWIKLPDATSEAFVWVTGAKGRWVDPSNPDEVYVTSGGDRYAIVTAPVRCGSDLRQACLFARGDAAKCTPITATPEAGNDILLDPVTTAPIAQPGIMFWSEGVYQPPSFPAVFSGVMRWDGAQIDPFAEVNEIEIGRYQTVSPDSEWGLWDSCYSASGFFREGECLLMQRLGVQDEATTLFPPGNPGFLRIHHWMSDRKTLLLTGIEYPGDHRRTYLFDVEKAAQCSAVGGTVDCSDPTNSPYTRVPAVEDNMTGMAPGTSLSGWVVYTSTDAVTRGWQGGSQVIDGQCREPFEFSFFDPAPRNAFLSPAVPSPVSSDRYLLMKYFEAGAWHLQGVTPAGDTFDIAPAAPRPHDFQAAWGPSGRTLTYHAGDQVVIADVGIDGTLTTRLDIGAAGALTGASLSFGSGGAYLAAFVPDTGQDVGTLHVFRTSTGAAVGSWTHRQNAGLPAWSGFGDQIVVVQVNPDAMRDDTDLIVIDLGSGGTSNITESMERVDCEGQMDCPHTNQYAPSWNRSIDWRR